MGRPERAVDPQAGPVPLLAHALRELRKAAGNPAYRTMAETAGFSATTLSQAAGGRRLPTLPVVQGYARACGADPGEWEERWKAALAGQLREETPDDTSPYRGLIRFEPDDRHLYFGRDRLIGELERLVCGNRFAVLFGASGSGKSSLLRAGLVPRLREKIAESGSPALLRVLTPGPRPAETYARLLAPAPGEPESWLLVDQFEETFTLCQDPAERDRFTDLLLAARDPASRLRVLIAVRADFYPRCAEHRQLADALHGAGLLAAPMTADELREAVVGPARAAGLLVERELTARIVDDVLDRPGALPMLSHALLETWRRRGGRLLTLAAYESAGGVEGAIAASAEQVHATLSPSRQEAARLLLLRLVQPGAPAQQPTPSAASTPDTRRPLTRAELDTWADPDVPPVVERLAAARLLTLDEDGVQLAHEALISGWPRLRDWLAADRERLSQHRALTEAARSWLEHDRDPGALYRGARLERADRLFPDPGHDRALTAPERDFLLTARAARAAEQRAAARTARRSRTLLTTLAAVLALVTLVTAVAWRQRTEDARHRTEDAARRVAAVADSLRTTDPRAAQLLGVASWQLAHLPETRRALLGALGQPERDTFVDPAPGSTPARHLIGSGHTLLSIAGHTWRTWDVTAHRALASGPLPAYGYPTAVAPDGRLVALTGPGGTRVWDTATRGWRTAPSRVSVDFTGADYVVRSLDDGRTEVHADPDGRTLLRTQVDSTGQVAAAGALIAVCRGTPQLQEAGRTLPGEWTRTACVDDRTALFLGPARLGVFTPDGVRVWNTTTGARIADLTDPGAQFAAFSPDGRFLATADSTELRVWRLGVDAPVLRYPLHNERLYGGPAWDPTGTELRYLEGGTVHTLRVAAAVTPAWQATPADATLLSPDGRTLAVLRHTGDRYRVDLTATADGRRLRTLPAPDRVDPALDPLPLLAFAPDGKTLAYGVSTPGNPAPAQHVTVWDLRRDRARTTVDLGPATTARTVLALALGGDTLYVSRSGVAEPTDEIWDLKKGRRTTVLTGLTGTDLALRPDGRLLAGDGAAVALPEGKVTGRDLVQGDEIGALAFATDGSLLAAGDQVGRVTLWDGRLRRRTGTLWNVFPVPVDRSGDAQLTEPAEAVSALAVSHDGRLLAVGGSAGTLQLWDIATHQPVGGPLVTPGESIDSLAFGADDDTLYAAGAHVPLQRYSVDLTHAVATVCARAGRHDLSRDEWETYLSDVEYRKVCATS